MVMKTGNGYQPQRAPSSRRAFIVGAGQLGVAAGLSQLFPRAFQTVLAQGSQVVEGKEKLIVRSIRPEDLETPVSLLKSWITPNDLFYVRHHLYAPNVTLKDWTLKVDGEVERALTLTLDELKQLPQASVTVTLECAGNARAFFDPPVAGGQ